jgi:hypothetical protein
MKAVYSLMNHQLTDKQTSELQTLYGADSFLEPPADIASLWAQIPAEQEITLALLSPVIAWLSDAVPGSPVIVQGEFGAVYAVVTWCLQHGLIPVYAASRRVSKEVREGERVIKMNIFEHVRFKEYKTF